MLSPAEELRFWTGIMRDHSEFILTSLSYNEQAAINTAQYFQESFSLLHEQSKALLETDDPTGVGILAGNAMTLLSCFINFKRCLLRGLLMCKLDTSLPPTFYNHMINEAVEFYKVLCRIQTNMPVNLTLENIHLHKIWLRDAVGHAASIACGLDPSECLFIKEAKEFEKIFNCLLTKAEELEKMLIRTCLCDGVLEELNKEARMKMEEFICYLDKLRKLRIECRVMGIFKPLVPDHMIREEKYYLSKVESFMKMVTCK